MAGDALGLDKVAELIKLIIGNRVLMFALSFGGWLLLWLARGDPTIFGEASWLKTAVYVIAVPVSVYFAALILLDLIKWGRAKFANRQAQTYAEAKLADRWDELDLYHRQVLAAMFVQGRREFFAQAHIAALRTLRTRGFLRDAPNQKSKEDWLWQIPDYVWRHLEQRRSEIGKMPAAKDMNAPWAY